MTTVVIATYNEKPNIEVLIPSILELPGECNILVVDDNSPDGTGQCVSQWAEKEPRVHLLAREKKVGYGPAMIAGLQQAVEMGSDSVVTMDADFSHNPKDIPRLVSALEHSDLALGSRYVGGVRVLNWDPYRLMLSMGASRYVRTILGLKIADCTSGFRAYRREALESVIFNRFRFRGYAFLVEILYRLLQQGCSAKEVDIVYTERRQGRSKMSKRVMFEAGWAPWWLKFRV